MSRIRLAVQVVKLLKDIEWAGGVHHDYEETSSCCPSCGGIWPDEFGAKAVAKSVGTKVGHLRNCRLVAIYARARIEAAK